MSGAALKIWEFQDAPNDLQMLVPLVYQSGWIAFLCPDARDLAEVLICWGNQESPVFSTEVEDGSVVLAGWHDPASKRIVS